jgi:hypothetical protein
VAYRFKTRSDDHIDACSSRRIASSGGSCYSDRQNSLRAALVKNFFRGTPQMKLKTGTLASSMRTSTSNLAGTLDFIRRQCVAQGLDIVRR